MSDPRITDEMVAEAERAWNAAYWTTASPGRHDWMRSALEAAAKVSPQPITSREPEDKALEGIRRWYAAMDAEEDSDLPWPSGLSADNPNLTPAAPRSVVDREALTEVINEVAVSTGLAKYFKSGGVEDPSDVEEFVAAVLALLNGGAK